MGCGRNLIWRSHRADPSPIGILPHPTSAKKKSRQQKLAADLRAWALPGFAVLTAIGTLRPTGRRPAISENLIYGAEGSRTPGLCSAIAALSQLSYSPVTGARQRTCHPVALRLLNDTTPLARGRTVDTKSTRAWPEVNQSATRRVESTRVTRSAASAYLPRSPSTPVTGKSWNPWGCGPVDRSRPIGTRDYGSSAAPNVGRGETRGERGVMEGNPSRLTETAVSRSWNRGVPFWACCCAAI